MMTSGTLRCMDQEDFSVFQATQDAVSEILANPPSSILPSSHALRQATDSLYAHLPVTGEGLRATTSHLLNNVLPGLNASSLSPNYYGFVTGGITPAARLADNLVTLYDQNVQVHLPNESVATIVEDRALCMLLELLKFEPQQWPARCFTTGATASNVLGLATGRDWVLTEMLRRKGLERKDGEGLLGMCRRAGVEEFQVLSTMAHSSLGKAASIIGLGSQALIDVSSGRWSLDFDMTLLEERLQAPNTASIVVISCGEVNTGGFATKSVHEMQKVRDLCDKYGAWIHVDGGKSYHEGWKMLISFSHKIPSDPTCNVAFGIFARVLPQNSDYDFLLAGTDGLELADSITGDCHKLLNVPYDCGFFLCRYREAPTRVFQNTNAAYLSGGGNDDGIMSPLNVRLENSARFRGLPVYATLVAYGQKGYMEMIARMVELARKIAVYIRDDCVHLELLPGSTDRGQVLESVYICVLFRAKDDALNNVLIDKIKASGKIYASGTKWDGKPAVRFAIGKWDVDVERDFAIVKDVLVGLKP